MSAISPADVLDAAADYIDEHGWTRLEMCNHLGQVCAIGAMRRASSMEDSIPARKALQAALGQRVTHWNDSNMQTAANVTATMRKVAADLRAETP